MELMEAIHHRRTVRRFEDREVAAELLEEIIEAAVQAPSAMNLQPWSFAVYCGRPRLLAFSDRIKEHMLATLPPLFELHEHTDHMSDPEYDVFHGAPALIVICAKEQGWSPAETVCLAAQNLMLAAHGLGLGTCPVGFVRAWFRLPRIKHEIGIPGSHEPVFPVVVGHPAEWPLPTSRREPDVVVWARARDGGQRRD
jgi:nitroreductase